jgi:hypothetical protein
MNNRNESNPVIDVFWNFPAEIPCRGGSPLGENRGHELLLAKMAKIENNDISY